MIIYLHPYSPKLDYETTANLRVVPALSCTVIYPVTVSAAIAEWVPNFMLPDMVAKATDPSKYNEVAPPSSISTPSYVLVYLDLPQVLGV